MNRNRRIVNDLRGRAMDCDGGRKAIRERVSDCTGRGGVADPIRSDLIQSGADAMRWGVVASVWSGVNCRV